MIIGGLILTSSYIGSHIAGKVGPTDSRGYNWEVAFLMNMYGFKNSFKVLQTTPMHGMAQGSRTGENPKPPS